MEWNKGTGPVNQLGAWIVGPRSKVFVVKGHAFQACRIAFRK
jgi:hypothetical protein